MFNLLSEEHMKQTYEAMKRSEEHARQTDKERFMEWIKGLSVEASPAYRGNSMCVDIKLCYSDGTEKMVISETSVGVGR